MNIPKTFRNYFLSYMIVFCIPTIALTYFCFSSLINQFKQMTYEREYTEQQKKVDFMDNSFEQIKNIAMQLGQQNIFDIDVLEQNIQLRRTLIEQLRYQLALSQNLDEIIFWIPNQELFYSTQTTYSPFSYYDIHKINLDEIMKKQIDNPDQGLGTVPNIFSETTENNRFLYFTCPYPYNAATPSAQLIFKMRANKFSLMEDKEYLLQFRNQVLVNNTALSMKEISAQNQSSGKITCIITDASVNQFKVTTVMHNKEVFYSVYQTRKRFILIILLVFAVSVFLLSFFSYKNYKPMKALGKTLVKLGVNSKSSTLASSEIFQSIEAMEKLSDLNHQLDSEVLKEKYISKALWLSKMVNNQSDQSEAIVSQLQKYNVLFTSKQYAVAIIYIDTNIQDNRYFDDHIFQDQFLQLYYYVDSQQKIILLIGGDEKLRNDLPSILGHICERLSNIHLSCEIHIGDVYSDSSKINLSYLDALSLGNEEIRYHGKILFYNPKLNNKYLFYPQAELDNLSDAFSKRDISQVHIILRTISTQLEHVIYDYSLCKAVCYDVANTIIKSFVQEDNSPEFTGILNQYLRKLNQTNSKQDFISLLRTLDSQTDCYFTQDMRLDDVLVDSESQMEQILDYISTNYTNMDFYLGEVAEHYHISQNNLSQQLKRVLRVSPAKYINVLRIDKAKQLLIQTNSPVKSIACQIGFADVSSFIRNFKTITSMTPNQYRAMH